MPWASANPPYPAISERAPDMEYTPLESRVARNEIMLTTTDNPINPFVNFDAWYAEDMRLGHDTCGLIARLYVDTRDMSSADQAIEYARVVREIFSMDVLNIYTFAVRPSYVKVDVANAQLP